MRRTIRGRMMTAAVAVVVTWPLAGAIRAEILSGNSLVDALKDGGYFIVMRQASTSSQVPSPKEASFGNTNRDPELDEMGMATAEAMSYAFRKFRIPVSDTFISPRFCAEQMARFFGFGKRHKMSELGMDSPSIEWLRKKVTDKPPAGQNDVIITQENNLKAAFGTKAANLEPGEAIIFRPDGADAEVVGYMPIKDWAKLAVLGHT